MTGQRPTDDADDHGAVPNWRSSGTTVENVGPSTGDDHPPDDHSTGDHPPDDHSTGDEAGPPTVDEAVERIHDRATTVRDRELETALSKLEGGDDLSPSNREVVADLADRLVEELVAVPESSLREVSDSETGDSGDDTGTEPPVETALELFS
jgi:hypothetical protein